MTQVLGIPLYDKSISNAVFTIIEATNKSPKKNYLISATGAHGMVYAQSHTEFKNLLNSFYLNLPDGMPGVWIGRLKGANEMQRCYGPDFFAELIKSSNDTSIKHFFCGGKEGVAEELKNICNQKFSNNNIVGTYSPPFRDMADDEMKELADEINSKEVNIIWIGLSTPKQEIFAERLSEFTEVDFICTVGAAFDFHTGKVKQAPHLIQRMGLEWLFRLLMEPKRLWKRYMEIVPMFIFFNLQEFLRINVTKK
jgi:N-acetylglucosaminyldiphosphoundecaprenol N-acetyl-beta-D-mannosaminyltransferase